MELMQAANTPNKVKDALEAMRLVHDHGFDVGRLIALRGLARSRDVGLEVVLGAALSGDLADIIKRPAVPRAEQEPGG